MHLRFILSCILTQKINFATKIDHERAMGLKKIQNKFSRQEVHPNKIIMILK